MKDKINTVEDLIKYVRDNNDPSTRAAVNEWVKYWSDVNYANGLRDGRFDIQSKIKDALGLFEAFEEIRNDIYDIKNPL